MFWPVAPRGTRVRLAGYVASPSSVSFLFRFVAPGRLFRGLGLSLTSRAATAAIVLTVGAIGWSSTSRSLAVGRRERADGLGWKAPSGIARPGRPNRVGSRGGSDIANRPNGWKSGSGGDIGYLCRTTRLWRSTVCWWGWVSSVDEEGCVAVDEFSEKGCRESIRKEWSPAEGDLYVRWGLRRIREVMIWGRTKKLNWFDGGSKEKEQMAVAGMWQHSA